MRSWAISSAQSGSLAALFAVEAPLRRELSYAVPPAITGQLQPGMRTRLPLGRRYVNGYCLGWDAHTAPEELKPVAQLLEGQPLFPAAMVPFWRRAAAYYQTPIGRFVAQSLPGLLRREQAFIPPQEAFYAPAVITSNLPRGSKQRQLWSLVQEQGELSLSQLRQQVSQPQDALQRLVAGGWLECHRRPLPWQQAMGMPCAPEDSPVSLTPDQSQALAQLQPYLQQPRFQPFLLHGVTGSGKTEVYLRAIDQVLAQQGQALVLVPEISLTPQWIARFQARFKWRGVRLAVLHSGLTDRQRALGWLAVAQGEVDVVIGVRSAVFAPLPRVQLLVVDEEHDASYKQQEGVRYHARDLALLRAQEIGCAVVLGSATPAVTSFYHCQQGRWEYLQLPRRVADRPLPRVEMLDMRQRASQELLSPELLAALEHTLHQQQQALLLLNRRGFAPYLLCHACGHTWGCPNCAITLTYYRRQASLVCHYCGYEQTAPDSCPQCYGRDVLPQGAGTERLQECLQEHFPGARIGRMDRASTRGRESLVEMIEAMRAGKIQILVGTQMVTTGHDFPGVTLAAVLDADSSLNFPDFRSQERTFALLAQVAGRAGRGTEPGRVLVQSYCPEHPLLQQAAAQDYSAFVAAELPQRQLLGYPPYGYLANLVLAATAEAAVEAAAGSLSQWLQQRLPQSVEVLGPAPPPLARLRGKFRRQILLKASERSPLQWGLQQLWQQGWRAPKGVQWSVDVDPVDML